MSQSLCAFAFLILHSYLSLVRAHDFPLDRDVCRVTSFLVRARDSPLDRGVCRDTFRICLFFFHILEGFAYPADPLIDLQIVLCTFLPV